MTSNFPLKWLKQAKIYPFCQTLNSSLYIAETAKKKFILKARPQKIFLHEANILSLLTKTRFHFIPEYFGITRFDKQKVMVQEFIEGTELMRSPKDAQALLSEVAKPFRRLQEIQLTKKTAVSLFFQNEYSGLSRLEDSLLLSCERKNNTLLQGFLSKALDEKNRLKSLIEKCMPFINARISPSLINGEPEIILSRKNKIYILDWECARYWDSSYDIAYLKYRYQDIDMYAFLKACYPHQTPEENIGLRARLWLCLIHLKNYYFNIQDFNCSSVYYKIPEKILKTLVKIDLERRSANLNRACEELQIFLKDNYRHD